MPPATVDDLLVIKQYLEEVGVKHNEVDGATVPDYTTKIDVETWTQYDPMTDHAILIERVPSRGNEGGHPILKSVYQFTVSTPNGTITDAADTLRAIRDRMDGVQMASVSAGYLMGAEEIGTFFDEIDDRKESGKTYKAAMVRYECST